MTKGTSEVRAQLADPAKVIVAIPTLNEAPHIAQTLAALMAQTPQMRDVRIVVSDGGSTDRTREIVEDVAKRHPNISLIHNPHRVQAAAVNLVVERCAEPQHEILVRVDAHARYHPGYVLKVADSLREHDVAALATVMDSVGESCFQKGLAWIASTKLGAGGSAHRGGRQSDYVDHGHHAGFDLAAFRAVGGYNRHFIANEDAELDYRIRKAGGRIWLDASIRMDYIVRGSLRKLAKQYWRYGRGRAQNLRTHKVVPRLRQVIPPIAVAACALSFAAAPVVPWALAVPGLYLLLIVAIAATVTAQHRSLCALWAGPALVCMHFAWGLGFLVELTLPRGGSGGKRAD